MKEEVKHSMDFYMNRKTLGPINKIILIEMDKVLKDKALSAYILCRYNAGNLMYWTGPSLAGTYARNKMIQENPSLDNVLSLYREKKNFYSFKDKFSEEAQLRQKKLWEDHIHEVLKLKLILPSEDERTIEKIKLSAKYIGSRIVNKWRIRAEEAFDRWSK
jgi:hypothetical protein